MKNRRIVKRILVFTAVVIFCAVSFFCFKEGYWTFNIPDMGAVQTTERYCTYFDKGNTVGVNSLHYNSGKYGFYMQYDDTKSFRGNYKFTEGKNIGRAEQYLGIEKIEDEAIANAVDYTVVEAKIKTDNGKNEITRHFVLVKLSEKSRWRVCWVG